MAIVSEFVYGGSWHLALSLEAKPADHSCYFTGNFTCNGDGTVTLNRDGNLWIGELTLPPGEYTYYFEIDQFIKVDEYRAPAESPLKLILKQKGLFHNPDDPSFAGTAGNLFIARCIGPPETGMLQMKFGAGEVKESITSYHVSEPFLTNGEANFQKLSVEFFRSNGTIYKIHYHISERVIHCAIVQAFTKEYL